MTILVLWALIAGQPAMASHEFGDPAACEKVRGILLQQIKREGASKIVAICSPVPR